MSTLKWGTSVMVNGRTGMVLSVDTHMVRVMFVGARTSVAVHRSQVFVQVAS